MSCLEFSCSLQLEWITRNVALIDVTDTVLEVIATLIDRRLVEANSEQPVLMIAPNIVFPIMVRHCRRPSLLAYLFKENNCLLIMCPALYWDHDIMVRYCALLNERRKPCRFNRCGAAASRYRGCAESNAMNSGHAQQKNRALHCVTPALFCHYRHYFIKRLSPRYGV